jgi:hypothetical protein
VRVVHVQLGKLKQVNMTVETRDQLMSLVRHIISVIGGILVAKGVLSDSVAFEIGGALVAIASLVWSVVDKTFVLGSVEGVLRQLGTAVAGYLIWKGQAETANQVTMWLGILLAVLSTVLGQTDKLWATATPKTGA